MGVEFVRRLGLGIAYPSPAQYHTSDEGAEQNNGNSNQPPNTTQAVPQTQDHVADAKACHFSALSPHISTMPGGDIERGGGKPLVLDKLVPSVVSRMWAKY